MTLKLLLILIPAVSIGMMAAAPQSGPQQPSTSVIAAEQDVTPHSPLVDQAAPKAEENEVGVYYKHPEYEELIRLPRELFKTDNNIDRIKQIIDLLSIPPDNTYAGEPLWPHDMHVREVYQLEDMVIVDLDPTFLEGLSRGSNLEELMVYSMVNTLVENVTGCKRVRILVNGQIAEVLLGHIDVEHPLHRRERLIFKQEKQDDGIEVEDLR